MATSGAHQAGAVFSCAAVCPFSLPPCWLWGQGWTCGEKEWTDAFLAGTTHKRWKPQLSPSTSSCFNSFPAKVQEQMSVHVWVKGQFRKAGWNHLLDHWSKIQWEKFSLAFPECLWPLQRTWRCWKSREWPVVACPMLVFNSFSAAGRLFLFIWGISVLDALGPHWILLRNGAYFRHGVIHQLLFWLISCLGREESILQVLAFTTGFPAPSGISSLPGWVLALISGFLWIQASFLL